MRKGFYGTIVLMMLLAGALGADALTINPVISPNQVFQCDENGVANIFISGTSTIEKGIVQVRITSPLPGAPHWAVLGKIEDGRWASTLTGISAGGPYRFDFRAQDEAGNTAGEASVHNILVGDIWVLAGQSNMQGVGDLLETEEPHPSVHIFSMGHEWRLAQEPLHILAESPDPVHFGGTSAEERETAIQRAVHGAKGAGLGLSFAKELVRRSQRPIGLICAAHGGTSMTQWDPALRDRGGESLYGSMMKQIENAGGRVRGVLWYQGESDANPEAQAVFREKFKGFVASMRSDLEQPELPFYYVQIGRFVHPDAQAAPWNKIQAEQLAAEAEIVPGAMVSSIDLALDDLIHIGTPGLMVLGQRMAKLAATDLFGGGVLRGPRFDSVKYVETPYGKTLRLRFSQVNGGLQSTGRLHGFSISSGEEGPERPAIYKQEIALDEPDTVVLWVWELPENPYLWYGRGLDPYCNLTDGENMSAPVFGPVPIGL
jgi:sialate O-acetylesterase